MNSETDLTKSGDESAETEESGNESTPNSEYFDQEIAGISDLPRKNLFH